MRLGLGLGSGLGFALGLGLGLALAMAPLGIGLWALGGIGQWASGIGYWALGALGALGTCVQCRPQTSARSATRRIRCRVPCVNMATSPCPGSMLDWRRLGGEW